MLEDHFQNHVVLLANHAYHGLKTAGVYIHMSADFSGLGSTDKSSLRQGFVSC